MLENMGTILMTANQKKDDGLTLDCVLNAIDGIIELHDAMLIFTTNHLEKIDPAFMRPGRIDYILELKHATVATIREMIEYKFRNVLDDFTQYQKYFDNMRDFVLSPADVQITCLKYKNCEIEECLKELVEKMQ
jgi:SpoVK/Ycf46/Vps4 family AAA+-type ATPase